MKWKNVTTLVSYISVREKKVIEISHIDRRKIYTYMGSAKTRKGGREKKGGR